MCEREREKGEESACLVKRPSLGSSTLVHSGELGLRNLQWKAAPQQLGLEQGARVGARGLSRTRRLRSGVGGALPCILALNISLVSE